MQLFVLAKQTIMENIKKIEGNAENTGFLGVFPNKVMFALGLVVLLSSLNSNMLIGLLSCVRVEF